MSGAASVSCISRVIAYQSDEPVCTSVLVDQVVMHLLMQHSPVHGRNVCATDQEARVSPSMVMQIQDTRAELLYPLPPPADPFTPTS